MNITRYPQSCLLIEDKGTRILIDPGSGFAASHTAEELGKLDAVLYTHEHADHFDRGIYEKFSRARIPCFSNKSVAALAPEIVVKESGESFTIGPIQISAQDLPHCLMVDGSKGPQNTGYLINERLFHPGDGVDLPGLHAEILALPIAGPDVSFKDAYKFALQLSAKHVIPIHYDLIGTKPDVFAGFAQRFNPGFTVHALHVSQVVEL